MLVAHAGSRLASEDEVRTVPSPVFTEHWHPINHGQYLDYVLAELAKKDLKVWKSEFSLLKDRNVMFGVLDLQLPHGLYQTDLTMSVGLRNSIDKSLAAAAAIGTRVFVCDNMAFSGEIVFSHKHSTTIEVELPKMIESAVSSFISSYKSDVAFFDEWKYMELTVPEATNFICEIAEVGQLHKNAILSVREEFKNPRFKDFTGKTVWSLFNAFTTYARYDRRQADPNRIAEESVAQTKAFKQKWPLTIAA